MEVPDRLFEDLTQLYANLDAALPAFSGNHCGDCRACCTAQGLSRHHVGQLEVAFLASHVGEEKANAFRQYAEREKGEDGGFLHDACPFYDLDTKGCSVYRIRPFSCRIFGHFKAANTFFPQGCVFTGHEQSFTPQEYLSVVPQARQLRELMRLHFAWRGSQPVRYADLDPAKVVPPGPDDLKYLSPDDPYDRALLHQVNGRYAEALEELMAIHRSEGDSAYLLYSIGMVLELMGAHPQAVAAFARAADLVPECASFHYHIGYNALSAGYKPLAIEHLRKTVELNPDHGLAMGFLGYIHLIDGQLEEGAGFMERAVAIDPDNGFFHLRLGLAWMSLGRHDEGIEQIQEATRFEPTRQQADDVLRATRHALESLPDRSIE